jgi:uncharacterized protein (TIGR02246 family)
MRAALAPLAILTILSASQVGDPGPSDEAAVRALIEKVEAANNAGDVEGWVGLFAPDFAYMAPGAPTVRTRPELVEVARVGFRNRASIAIDPVEIEICGDWAYVRSHVTGTVKLHGSGETAPVRVKQLEILRRHPDGWRIARLMMNGDR